MTKPKLSEIAESMDCQSEEITAFLNRKTGEIEMVTGEELRAEEDGENAGEKYEGEDWLPLPSKYDIHDYEIMESFCATINDPTARNSLIGAIKGRGAFQKFRRMCEHYGLMDKWYGHKNGRYLEIAREWCKANQVEYQE
ncbi:MAG: hypothetical protein A2487_02660 [Candidatus Raymondbacteria bacterium RifOxyC12_full_50_8]|uniref:Uncharacterized protein n=1 Tax=Candidatus Raymondbacteria bacterium RIFOXYD12_FULL_49_13 TaxID=1817890 RepID=A0A1F7F9K5_UNCRA|nr:MAG: hypothetical protein A2350_06730 [Candidatus Raymondbacteria bacterium RifOxyB12_full_50_8]OGJ93230.1 MAG: hypothetical protein A2248_17830 [Candidatus Raymondbacteria bacterium RIFOXYA2_FULL_49_16]OGJ94752.1 MAG: hypothetical protein A2487_02660 [Candidatus Raymondbacteria bacterium RifOxyC12_full_50_8]OGK03313.1 MAG: hypothetical protein A2519_15175 [Candidatus Raymondbacteria bacterium RIFOXYD12_FULL_49_13]OGP44952.1 MAG: hypothetical protein A2324_19755 [Candidatus Raymondbacteria b